MSELFSAGWCEELNAALGSSDPAGSGGSGVVEVVVTGASSGGVRLHWQVEGGALVRVSPAAASDLAVGATMKVREEDLVALVRGDLDPAVGFMRGDLKPEGSSRAVFALLSALSRQGCREALAMTV